MKWAGESIRGTVVDGAGALGLALSVPFALGGCAQSVTTQTIKSPVLEHRTQVNASEPLLRGEWQVDGGRVVGHVVWGSCVSQRSWSVEEQQVEHVRPIPAAGLLTAGAGVAAIVAGIVMHSTEPTTTCTDAPGYQSCVTAQPDNSTSNAAILIGTLALVTGGVLLGVKPKDKVTVLKHEPHAETSVLPCIAAEDLPLMLLVLKLGANRFVHVTVDASGDASADLPPIANLPKGADLEVLVYRAPPVFAKTLPRWTSVGHVHVLD